MRYHIVRRAELAAPLTYPAYWDLMTVGTWYPLSGPSPGLGLSATNTADSVDPDPTNVAPYRGGNNTGWRAMWDKWNGGIYAPTLGQYGSLCNWGGGHQDYNGNGMARWDVDTRVWTRLITPSSAGPFTSGAALTNGLFVDGTAAPAHTYNFQCFHPPTDSYICLKSIDQIGAPDNGGNANAARPLMISLPQALLGNVIWRRGALGGGGLQSPSQGSACYDSIRDCFYTLHFSVGRFGKFSNPNVSNGDGTYGVWTIFNPSGDFGFDQSMGHDPVNDWVIVADSNRGNFWRKDPNNMGGARTAITLSGTPTLDTQSSLCYSSAMGGFVYHRNNSGAVHRVSTSNGWANATFTSLTQNTNGQSFAVDTNGGGFFSKSQTVERGTRVVQYLTARPGVPVLGMRLQ